MTAVCESCGEGIDPSRRGPRRRFCGDCYRKRESERARRYYAERPVAAKARYLVNLAVERGDLPRIRTQTCVDCGRQAQAYDHRDYTKPLEVEPVCGGCNKRRGPGYPYTKDAA